MASSSGGHLEQLQCLSALSARYDCVLVTEKTSYAISPWQKKVYLLPQVNRKECWILFRMFAIVCQSLCILIREKPEAIICTGVLATVPLCMLGKLFGKKVIFIESFAKQFSATRTGKLIYRFADVFIVQWDSMKEVYPKAIVGGPIY